MTLLGAACGEGGTGTPPTGCDVPVDPGPMSAARAAVIAPEVRTGLGLSVTHVSGDCRPRPVAQVPAGPCGDGRCRRARAPLEVLVVAANVSVPLDPRCEDAPNAEALRALAADARVASEVGEVVFALPAGTYSPHLVASDGCAPCGDPGAGACAVRVEDGQVAARDLVLDEASH